MRTMPTNSELLLIGYDAWNRDDCQAWLDCLHPDVEISTSGVFPDLSAEYSGHALATKFWRQLHAPWEVFRIDVEHVEDDGDCALAAIRFRATGVDSGVEVDMRFGMGIRVRDGLASHMVNRRTMEEAREALRPKQPAAASQPA
ncbi:MAG: nuclear transport factor 2 family protein [Thermoleophilaceae bacterium]